MGTLVDVVNQALTRLGHATITALTDQVRAAKVANAQATVLLDDELRRNVWKFARARTKLVADPTAPVWGFTRRFGLPAGLGTVPYCIRALEIDGEDESTGRWSIEGRFLVSDLFAPQQSLDSFSWTTVNTANNYLTVTGSTYVAGDGPLWLVAGTGGLPAPLLEQHDYYASPALLNSSHVSLCDTKADALAGTNLVDITGSSTTGPHLIGPPALSLLYVSRISDPDLMDPAFRSLLVARYAAEWAEVITGNPTKVMEMQQILITERRLAPTAGSQEGIPDDNQATDWISARFGGTPSSPTPNVDFDGGSF